MSWEDFKEKHKEQLSDRLGSGIEKEQADYRRLLDEERNRKVRSPCMLVDLVRIHTCSFLKV